MRRSATFHYLMACSVALLACWVVAAAAVAAPLPLTLSATGFPVNGKAPSFRMIAYSPQYPLWTDGADKQRWLALPPGRFIDASKLDAWSFPTGTRIWKQFAFDGKPVETRFMLKGADGNWQFASYLWQADGKDAVLAPERGTQVPVAAIQSGRYAIPSRMDCLVCHGSARTPVLGLSAVQLSSARDPLAPPLRAGELDLAGLAAAGWVRKLSALALSTPPRIAARNPDERAALGYLHGNCAHCHNSTPRKAPLDLNLEQRAADADAARRAVLASTVGQGGRYGKAEGSQASALIAPGQPERSLLIERMKSRHAATQMPPLGTQMVDHQAIALLTRWIATFQSD